MINILKLKNLSDKVKFIPQQPHSEAISYLRKSAVLLLLINDTANQKGIIPGKFFEYLAAERTILCLGQKDSDIAGLLEKTGAGLMTERNDPSELKKVILMLFENYSSGKNVLPEKGIYSLYSRRNAAGEFLNLI